MIEVPKRQGATRVDPNILRLNHTYAEKLYSYSRVLPRSAPIPTACACGFTLHG